MANWNGQLPANQNFSVLYNMVINGIYTYADNIKGTFSKLAREFKQDAPLYGSTKLYYDIDILKSREWDGSDFNVLEPEYPPEPKTEAIKLDKFRQIGLTLDEYLTKNAFMDEYSFSQFRSAIQAQIGKTREIYESTLVNMFVGTSETNVGKQTQSLVIPKVTDVEQQARIKSRMLAEKVSNIYYSDLQDVSTDYNDNQFYKSFDEEDMMFIWNNDFYQNILKTDLPAAYFDQTGTLIPKFGDHVLPSRFFGTINSTSGTTVADNKTVRAAVEKDYGGHRVRIGELLPNTTAYEANETYTVDPTIAVKIIHKKAVPFFSTFNVTTNFMNAKSLKNNIYNTWGYAIGRLKGYPYITLRCTVATTVANK